MDPSLLRLAVDAVSAGVVVTADMKARQSRRLKQATLVLGGCLALYCLLFVSSSTIDDEAPGSGSTRSTPRPASSKLLTPELLANLSLSEEQCNAAFPGLTKEIDDAVAEGPFKVKSTGDRGHLQGRIKDGQVCWHRAA